MLITNSIESQQRQVTVRLGASTDLPLFSHLRVTAHRGTVKKESLLHLSSAREGGAGIEDVDVVVEGSLR